MIKNLPNNWILVNIEDISLEPKYGWTTSAVDNGILHLLRTTDITSGQIDWETVPYCKNIPEDKEKYLLNDGDIVISRAGSVGYSYLIKNPQKAVFASYLIRFRPLINEKYFAHYLQSPDYWQAISENSLGIAVPNVNASKLKQINIPLPPLKEQKRIVEKIDRLFEELNIGIEELKKVQEQIKQYRQSVLKYAFEGKFTEDWRKKNRDKLKKEYKKLIEIASLSARNDDMVELPDGWIQTSFDQVAEINPKLPYTKIADDKEVSFLPMKLVEEETGKINLELTRFYKDVKKGYTSFINDDVIFAKITPCMENGKIAIVKNLKNGIGYGSTEFHVIRTRKELLHNKYMYFYILQECFRKEARRSMTGTAGQLRVPSKYLENISIPLPIFQEQQKIIEEIEKRFAVADEVEKVVEESLRKAERLRQSILKTAFEGKLVAQDPNDEPAEKLLERIKQEKKKLLNKRS